jgi:hypothetical protein
MGQPIDSHPATQPHKAALTGAVLWREPHPESEQAIRAYGARLLTLLERPAPLLDGTRNVLAPRLLPLSAKARGLWIRFADNAEAQLAPGGGLESIRPLGNKAAEHSARMAAVLALVSDPDAGEVDVTHMACGVRLAEHFLAEALRLAAVGKVHPDIRLAQRTLDWLRSSWPHAAVSPPDLYQRGPSGIRDKKTAHRVASILEDHGYLVDLPDGATIDGTRRREAWEVVR